MSPKNQKNSKTCLQILHHEALKALINKYKTPQKINVRMWKHSESDLNYIQRTSVQVQP